MVLVLTLKLLYARGKCGVPEVVVFVLGAGASNESIDDEMVAWQLVLSEASYVMCKYS